jgi:hypothetical protein
MPWILRFALVLLYAGLVGGVAGGAIYYVTGDVVSTGAAYGAFLTFLVAIMIFAADWIRQCVHRDRLRTRRLR